MICSLCGEAKTGAEGEEHGIPIAGGFRCRRFGNFQPKPAAHGVMKIATADGDKAIICGRCGRAYIIDEPHDCPGPRKRVKFGEEPGTLAAPLARYVVLPAPPAEPPLCAADVNEARLDTDAFGRIFPELRLAAALQVLRSIAQEQPAVPSAVRALAEAAVRRLS